jgi:hypothetical protein
MRAPDPSVTAARLLADLRAGEARAARARAQVACAVNPADTAGSDTHAALRAEVAAALIGALGPRDHEVVRWLLEQEVAAHEAAGQGASETLYALVAAVARFASPEDALLLWRAREATPATRAGMDVEQLARAGVERVRMRLRALAAVGGLRGSEAQRALAWFEEGLAAGALDDLAGYFAWSDERFGLAVRGPV